MSERSAPGKVTRSGSATVSGGIANTGIHYGDVNILPAAPVRTRYLGQVERIAPLELEDRHAELAELTEFCTAPDTAGTYAWWRAPAWSGKSALMSWFVLHPPRGVRIVSFFITARLASQNDRGAFVDNVLEQLLAMQGEALPPFLTESTRDAHLLGLLGEAAEACRARGEEFVLLVDGLDEDRGAGSGPDAHSIAALLPAQPPAGMRVVVAGRPNPPIPGEVPAHHPLRDDTIVRQLKPSPKAQAVREEMERDLLRLLEGTTAEQDLLGLVTAAGGGLSTADLAELTGWSHWEINRRLRTVAGRSFAVRGSEFRPGGPEVFLLGHEQLQVTAVEMFGSARLAGYRDRLHAWAQQHRAQRWGQDTPEYLLRGYFRMLHATGDVTNMVLLGTDPDRHDRMLDLSGGDAVALSEIATVLDVLAEQAEPDLVAMVRLSMHRDHLSDRNSNMPTDLPAAWARLGEFHRAKSLAESLPVDSRVTGLVSLAEAVAETGDQQRAHDVLEQAETATSFAHSGNVPSWQAQALASVARGFTRVGDRRRAEEVRERAETLARSFTDPGTQSRALASLAGAAVEAGDHQWAHDLLEQAETAARSVRDSNEQGAYLLDVVEAVAGAGECRWAETIARSIPASGSDSDWQVAALAAVAAAVVAAGDHRRAEAIAYSLTGAEAQAQALASVARAVSEAGDHQRARSLFERAETLARSIGDNPHAEAAPWSQLNRNHTLLLLATAVAEAGECRWAETIARSITEDARQSRALRDVATAAAKTGDHEWTETVAESITSGDDQAAAMVSLAGVLTDKGDRQAAREVLHRTEAIARSRTRPDERVNVLTALAVSEAVDRRRARELLEHATALALEGGCLPWTSMGLAGAVAAAGDWQAAERIARSLPLPSWRDEVLLPLARNVAEAGDLQEAERIARSLAAPGVQAKALVSVAKVAAEAGDLEQARTVVRSLTGPVQQVEAWAFLTGTAAETGDQKQALECLEQAETAARSVADPYWKAWTLIDVSRAMASVGDNQRAQEVMDEAEAAACSVTDSGEKAWALVHVARDVASRGDERKARGILARAETLIRSLAETYEREQVLVYLAESVLETGDHQWAEKIARSITEPNEQEDALAAVARALTKTGDHHGAELTVRFLTDPSRQGDALRQVAEAVAQAGDHQQAEKIARSITVRYQRAWALVGVAQVVIEAAVEAGEAQRTHAVRMIVDALRLDSWDRMLSGVIQAAPAAAEAILTELEILGGVPVRPGAP
jgi:tetratricopeptide (TPR) repeat protein